MHVYHMYIHTVYRYSKHQTHLCDNIRGKCHFFHKKETNKYKIYIFK